MADYPSTKWMGAGGALFTPFQNLEPGGVVVGERTPKQSGKKKNPSKLMIQTTEHGYFILLYYEKFLFLFLF